jgi:outer membrane protein insertion porin family
MQSSPVPRLKTLYPSDSIALKWGTMALTFTALHLWLPATAGGQTVPEAQPVSWGQALPQWSEPLRRESLEMQAVPVDEVVLNRDSFNGGLLAQSADPSLTPGDTPPPADTPANIDRPAPAEESIPTEPPAGTAPAGTGETISDIQVRFQNREGQPTRGQTRPNIFRREFDLQPGDVYDQQAAQQGLDRIALLGIVRRADLALEPAATPDQAVMVVTIEEDNAFTASISTISPIPSALQGPIQLRTILGPDEDSGFAIAGSARLQSLGGGDQTLALQGRVGGNVLDGELLFIDPWIGNSSERWGYAVNLFNQRAVPNTFNNGDRDVDLRGGDNPWVHRLGGGVEVFRPIAPGLTVALGTSYQRVSVRDDLFSSDVFAEDEEGNALTVSDDGQDDLLTVNFSAALDRRNDVIAPTGGYRLRFGIDQAIPIGDASIDFTRLSANYVQYLPVSLFGFAEGPRTLVLTLQGGTILGDVPPYDAFNLDSGPIRQYGGEGFGTGSSLLLAGAEYRFPIANFNLFRRPINLGGALFAGYATDLGTADEVIGEPAIVRDQPGDGFSYGIGLRARTPIGLLRLELGFSDEGGEVVFTTGDSF